MREKSPDTHTHKHTPGPWHIGMKPGPIVYGPKGEQVALPEVFLLDREEGMANARFIAAAPELYTAAHAAYGPLRMAALVCGSHGLAGTEEALEQIASALEEACAKAEGSSDV